ncbi:MAG: family 10 glycosylhydrolase, partial [Anaerolineae bacterium]|nr:family 10 glycosylhydrolase [Anaerolineae bacterium]
DGWHSGMWTAGQIDTMISTAYNANYNVIVPQVRKKGDALYNSTYGGPTGTGEPKPSQVSPPEFDPLAYMLQQAHAVGIEVHPWVCTHRVPTQTYDWFYTYYNHWLTKNSAGNLVESDGYWLDPGV